LELPLHPADYMQHKPTTLLAPIFWRVLSAGGGLTWATAASRLVAMALACFSIEVTAASVQSTAVSRIIVCIGSERHRASQRPAILNVSA